MTDPADTPAKIVEEILDEITTSDINKPRNLQTTVGPSALGTPCTRWLMHLINGDTEQRQVANWPAWVGTAMHSELERVFNNSFQTGRYLTEQRVLVGTIGGKEIWGNIDLFDTATGTVIDFKSAGKSSMVSYERSIRLHQTVGPKYETQLQTYGLGMLLAGHKVTQCVDLFLPRDGRLDQAFFYAAPFNPQIAMTALARCNQLADQIEQLGFETAISVYPACGGKDFCPYCPWPRKETPPDSPDDPFGIGPLQEGNTK